VSGAACHRGRAKLAVIATHPIQYLAPWFAHLQCREALQVKVFYLWNPGAEARVDCGFGVPVRWDIPLLEGYDYEFIANRSPRPGTGQFLGLWNPSLLARVREFRPDAVLLTAYKYASIPAFLARWRMREAPLLFRGDSHRLVPRKGILSEMKRVLLARQFRRFAACLYVGAANRKYFQLHGVPDARLFHSPHAVDNERFFCSPDAAEAEGRQWKRSLGIPEESRVILFAGKFEQKKRPLDLLQAFRAAGLPRAALLFVGSGPLDAELRAAAEGMPDVFFAPFQNQSSMPRTYAAGDLFVLPSFGPSETWGLAVNEAMCMGRPVIVSTHVGCAQDLVIPRSTGLTFEAGNVGALAAALKESFADPERLREWGANGRRRIEGFDFRHASRGLLKALAQVGAGGALRPQ